MRKFLQQFGFTPTTLFSVILITANAQLIYAFWDIRNSVPGGFPHALGVTDAQAGVLYSMQGLVIILGTIAVGWVGDRFSIRTIMMISTVGVGGISLFITIGSPHLSMPVLIACFFSMLFFSEVLFKPANFKALRVSTSADHQAAAFGFFEFGRGLLAFLLSLLWAFMVGAQAGAKTIMYTACAIIIVAGVAVFLVVPKDQKVGDEAVTTDSTKEAIAGVAKVAKLPVVWIVGINAFCIYGTFVAVGTYFARFLEAGYGASATAAAVFASTVIGLRMLPLVSTLLVEKVFKSVAHFMRTMESILAIVLFGVGVIFFSNHPSITEYQGKEAPAGLISPSMFWLLIVLMLVASALCFMIRGVYYAPIGEFGVEKKHSSSAMSFAITIGYIPALLAPLVFGGLITPSKVDETTGEIITHVLTDTSVFGYACFGLAILTLIAVMMSHWMVKHRKASVISTN